jgi:hypothetical protein
MKTQRARNKFFAKLNMFVLSAPLTHSQMKAKLWRINRRQVQSSPLRSSQLCQRHSPKNSSIFSPKTKKGLRSPFTIGQFTLSCVTLGALFPFAVPRTLLLWTRTVRLESIHTPFISQSIVNENQSLRQLKADNRLTLFSFCLFFPYEIEKPSVSQAHLDIN